MKSLEFFSRTKIRTAMGALLAAAVGIGVLWIAGNRVASSETTWERVIVEAAEGGYELIGTPDLCNRYRGDPANLLIVDIRQDWEYSAGHIKGATNFPFEPTWWARWWKQGELEKLLGPDKNRFTVFCGAGLS